MNNLKLLSKRCHEAFSNLKNPVFMRVFSVFGIIPTQRYHIYRALHIANALGLDAYGVAAEDIDYYGQELRELREILARTKDFYTSVIKPEPTYLGEAIPVSGDGNITND